MNLDQIQRPWEYTYQDLELGFVLYNVLQR